MLPAATLLDQRVKEMGQSYQLSDAGTACLDPQPACGVGVGVTKGVQPPLAILFKAKGEGNTLDCPRLHFPISHQCLP